MRSMIGLPLLVLLVGCCSFPDFLAAGCPECGFAYSCLTCLQTGEIADEAGKPSVLPVSGFGSAAASHPTPEDIAQWTPSGRPGSDMANRERPVVSDEKRQVPKKQKSKKKGEREDNDEPDEDGGKSGGFSDCLGNLFLSILCRGDGDADVQEVVEENALEGSPYSEEQLGYSVDGVKIPFAGVILPESPSIDKVNLWSAPGGSEFGGEVVSSLERGTKVQVLGLQHAYPDAPWLWVSAMDPAEVSGWVHVDYVVPEELVRAPLSTYAPDEPGDSEGGPAEADISPDYFVQPSRWHLVGQVGWSAIESELRDEFGWSGIEGRAAARFFPIPNLLLGLRMGYTRFRGDPEFDYEIHSDGRLVQKDITLDSDLHLFHLEAQVGARLHHIGSNNSPWYVLLALGAGVTRVEQSGPIEYEKYDQDGHVVDQGHREDAMVKWRGSLGFSGEVGYTFGSGLMLGLNAGMRGVHWEAGETESLSLDWLEGDFISIFYSGLSIGYAID